jgi:hypothetical protein
MQPPACSRQPASALVLIYLVEATEQRGLWLAEVSVYLARTSGAAQLRLPSCTAHAQSPIDPTSFGGHLLQGEEQKTLNSTRLKLDVRCSLGQVSSLFFQLSPRRPLLHPPGRPQYPSSPCFSFSRCHLHRVFPWPPATSAPLAIATRLHLYVNPSAAPGNPKPSPAPAAGSAPRALSALLAATTQILRTYSLCAAAFDSPGAPGLPATLRRMFLLPPGRRRAKPEASTTTSLSPSMVTRRVVRS